MERSFAKGLMTGAICACLVGLAGCSSSQPREFTGAWRPVNRFGATSARVPLRTPYVFQASPLDVTLKGMLARWAEDAGMHLDYRLPYDFTLYRPAADVRSERISDAIAGMDALYAKQQVAITMVGDRIVVEPRAATPSPETSMHAIRPAGSAAGQPPDGELQ